MPSNRLKAKPKHSFSFEAIGTAWSIDVYGDFSEKIKRALLERIEVFDKNYSRFRNDSLVARISEKAGTYVLPGDAKTMMDLYRQLYDATGGLLTPLIGSVISEAGYDRNYSFKPQKLHAPKGWDEVLSYKDNRLTTTAPVVLDFGAVGKGYLVDILGKLLEDHGIESYCIDASGDILCKNLEQIEKIGLENPDAPGSVIGILKLNDGALCGSGINRRVWHKYHHIMNPKTLQSQQGIKAVWVQSSTAALADGLSTALFFCDAAMLINHFSFDYALVRSDNSIEYSPKFTGTFFA